mmetsp:Transcript_13805/g.23542  ORF Transcript_13805/g.23542 Transcript_13805/m.23542 type:complete len:95 (+) Transcript_13805:175-459(+)
MTMQCSQTCLDFSMKGLKSTTRTGRDVVMGERMSQNPQIDQYLKNMKEKSDESQSSAPAQNQLTKQEEEAMLKVKGVDLKNIPKMMSSSLNPEE